MSFSEDMPRYTTKPRQSWIEDDEWIDPPVMPSTMTVHEDEDDGFTGLFDSKGNPIYRVRPRMGFVG